MGWDDANRAISLTSSKAYTAIGGEMTNESNNNPAVVAATVKIYLDNKELSLTAYNIDGNNYFKLRDIMKALNVFVGYDDSMKTITLDTSKGYVD